MSHKNRCYVLTTRPILFLKMSFNQKMNELYVLKYSYRYSEAPDRKTKNSKFEKRQNGPPKNTMCRNSTSFARIILKINPQIDIELIYNISKNENFWSCVTKVICLVRYNPCPVYPRSPLPRGSIRPGPIRGSILLLPLSKQLLPSIYPHLSIYETDDSSIAIRFAHRIAGLSRRGQNIF